MNKRIKPQPAGFTLVEVLAAGVILALSALVLGTIITQGMHSLVRARDYQRAAELLDETLTKIDIIGPARLLYEGPLEEVFASPHDGFAWQAQIEQRTEGYLYEVTVSILWTTPAGEQRSVQAQTLLNDAPDSRPVELDWYSL